VEVRGIYASVDIAVLISVKTYFHCDLMYKNGSTEGLAIENVARDENCLFCSSAHLLHFRVRIMCGCVLIYGYTGKMECMAVMSTHS
jgi:hypothetical protein